MTNTNSTDPSAQPTDLESYLRVHRMLRASTADLRHALDQRVGDRSLATWIKGLTGEIRCHHHIEDELLFPALADRVAAYHEEIGPILAQDHDELDRVLDGLDASAAAGDWTTAGSLARELDEQRSVLASAPAAMHLLWVLTRRGYARRTARALGGAH